MRIRSIYGVDDDGGVYGKKERQQKRAKRKQSPRVVKRRAKIKALSQRAKKGVKKALTKGKTVGFASLRIAFLALLKVNVHNLAYNLNEAIKKDPNKVKAFWEKFGGSFDQLQKTIASGATKKKIFDVYSDYNSSINSVTIAAAIAAATPVVIAAVNVLKGMGIGTKKDAEALEGDMEKVADKAGITADDADYKQQAATDKDGDTPKDNERDNSKIMMGVGAALLLALAMKGGKKGKK